MDMITLLKALKDERITFLSDLPEDYLSQIRYIDYLGNRLENLDLVHLDYSKPIYVFSDLNSFEIMVTNVVPNEFLTIENLKGFIDSIESIEEYPNLYFIND